MAGKGYGSAKARVLRLTRLDECGVPVYGECASLVSGGFIRVQAAAEYEDGEEFIQKNAWGEFCINEKDPDRLKRYNLTLDFCQVHPDVADIAAGADIIEDGDGNAIGFSVGEDVADANFALELWTKVTGGDQCATPGTPLWHYWVWPRVKVGRIGDLTFEYGPLTLTIDASTLAATDVWDESPYSPRPMPTDVAIPAGQHFAYLLTDVAPPAATEGCVSLAVLATGATAGIPGSWTPAGSTPPASVAALIAGTPNVIVAAPTTAWTVGQYVQTGAAGLPGQAHWSGTAWVAGAA